MPLPKTKLIAVTIRPSKDIVCRFCTDQATLLLHVNDKTSRYSGCAYTCCLPCYERLRVGTLLGVCKFPTYVNLKLQWHYTCKNKTFFLWLTKKQAKSCLRRLNRQPISRRK